METNNSRFIFTFIKIFTMIKKIMQFRKEQQSGEQQSQETENQLGGAGNAETSGANEQADASRGESTNSANTSSTSGDQGSAGTEAGVNRTTGNEYASDEKVQEQKDQAESRTGEGAE